VRIRHESVLFEIDDVIEGDEGKLAPAFAQAFERLVDRDAGKPRRERGVAAKLGQRVVGTQIRLLDRFLGFGVVLHDTPRRAVQGTIVPSHDRFERAMIAARGALRELGFGKLPEVYVPCDIGGIDHHRSPDSGMFMAFDAGRPIRVPDQRQTVIITSPAMSSSIPAISLRVRRSRKNRCEIA
jgi:hypothetical protein